MCALTEVALRVALCKSRRSLWATFVAVVWLFGGGVGCQAELRETAVTPQPAFISSSTNTPNPVATNQPPPSNELSATTPPATATLRPTPAPAPTTRPILTLALPPAWQTAGEAAIIQLEAAGAAWDWQLTDAAGAQIRLVDDDSGVFVRQEPLVLAVPFTTDWEATSQQNAQDILQNGHELVTVLPWSELQPTQKALRIDGRFPTDPDYPFQKSWSLLAEPGLETVAAELATLLQTHQEEALIHLAAVGDIMLDRSLGYALEQGNWAYPFAGVAQRLQAADVTVGNIESALGDVGEPAAKRYPFRAPPQAAAALALAGFDVVSLANNHALDYGPEALLQALDLLRAQGVAVVGAGADAGAAHAPVIVDVNGLRAAFLGYVHVPVEALSGFDTASWTATADSPGMAWADPDIIKTDVTTAAAQADLVVVVLHSGYEYVAAPSEPQMAAARAAIDAGADLVIGHHAHILQGVEFYNDGVILYGAGNFAFEIDGPPETAVFHVWLDRDGVRQIEIEPAVIQFGGQPRLADSGEAYAIRQIVYGLTNLLNP